MAEPKTPSKPAKSAPKGPNKEPNANPAPKDPAKANPTKAGEPQKR